MSFDQNKDLKTKMMDIILNKERESVNNHEKLNFEPKFETFKYHEDITPQSINKYIRLYIDLIVRCVVFAQGNKSLFCTSLGHGFALHNTLFKVINDFTLLAEKSHAEAKEKSKLEAAKMAKFLPS